VRESRKIDKAKGGGARAYPTVPMFIDLFALTPICMWPEINGQKTQVWDSPVQYSAMQCSTM